MGVRVLLLLMMMLALPVVVTQVVLLLRRWYKSPRQHPDTQNATPSHLEPLNAPPSLSHAHQYSAAVTPSLPQQQQIH